MNSVAGAAVPIRNNTSFGAHLTWKVDSGALLALEWEQVATTVSKGADAQTNQNARFTMVGRYSF